MKVNKRNSFFTYLVLILNYLALFSLLLAYLSKFISPENLWFLSFFGLAYPALFIVNLIFIIYWALKRRLYFLYSLFTVLIGFSLPRYYLKFGSSMELSGEHESFRVLSYNVHDFNYYSKEKLTDDEDYDKIRDFVINENPDIACFQEFYSHDLKPDRNNWLKLRLKAGYLYGERMHYNDRSKRMYLVILSKYPIINKGFLDHAEANKDITGIYADVKIKGKIVRVYNVHLNTMGISSDSHFFTRSYDIALEQDIEVATNGAKIISSGIKRGFVRRASQAKQINKHISNSPYPVLLVGDFNDTPCSYAYTKASSGLNDAFTKAGKGFSNTFNNGIYPSYRIDYILFDDYFTTFNYRRIKLKASDHYPILCDFIFNEIASNE